MPGVIHLRLPSINLIEILFSQPDYMAYCCAKIGYSLDRLDWIKPCPACWPIFAWNQFVLWPTSPHGGLFWLSAPSMLFQLKHLLAGLACNPVYVCRFFFLLTTMAKIEIIYPKNMGAKVAMNFIYNELLASMAIIKGKKI